MLRADWPPPFTRRWNTEVERQLEQFRTFFQQLWKFNPEAPGDLGPGSNVPIWPFQLEQQAAASGAILFRNDNAGTVPAHSLMRITGAATVGTGAATQRVVTCDQPNIFGSQYNVIINGDEDVASGAIGQTAGGPVQFAAYDTGDGTPVTGESWGPRSGTWKLKKNTGGFQVVGNAVNGYVQVQRVPWLSFRGVSSGAITAGSLSGSVISLGSGTVKVYINNTIVTGVTVTAKNSHTAIGDNKIVECNWFDNQWNALAADC
ncbi:MAG: hypothetical protein KGL39_17080 [Patescibacteria group bacterium]|nr:hypothetical protein [Patescibacteria group bacterium]